MNQQKRVVRIKLKRNYDRITGLPEAILSKIISLLPLKEAIRTSVLSKSWSLIWTNHPDIILDPSNILGNSGSDCCVATFIKRVDQVMLQRSRGPKMDSIAISFPIGLKNVPHISRWIDYALVTGVEKIDVDLSEMPFSNVPEQCMSPSLPLPAHRKECRVKHLRLNSCDISLLSISDSLISLVTVDLRGVSVNDRQMEHLLRTNLSIERMVLSCCDDLSSFKLTNPRSKLKFLTIQNCSRITNIELYAGNLEMLEYTGQLVLFSFKNVPKLADVFLCFTGDRRLDGVTYALSRIAHDVPQLETLNLISILAITKLKLPEKVFAFSNIKQLVLSICPFLDDDKLCWISYILKAFPFLNKLQLNLFSPVFIKKLGKVQRQLPERHHQHLKELEISGFFGNQHELELLKYLVDSAFQLDLLVINPSQKVYRGFNNWDSEESCPGYKLKMERIAQIHEIVPSTVQVKIF